MGMSGYDGEDYTDAPEDTENEEQQLPYTGLGRGKHIDNSTGSGFGRGGANLSRLKAILAQKQKSRGRGRPESNN